MRASMRVLLFTSFIIFLLMTLKFRVPEKKMGRVVATIDKEEISHAEFITFARKLYPEDTRLTKQEKIEALNQLINQKIILQYAKENKLFEKELSQDFEKEKSKLYDELLIKHLFNEEVKKKSKITSKELKQIFAKNEFVSVFYIAVSRMKSNSKELLQKIKPYVYSYDTYLEAIEELKKSTKVESGFVGYYIKKQFPEPYTEIGKELTKENMCSSIFETPYGFAFLFRGKNPSFKEAETFLKIYLEDDKRETLRKRFISKITENITINYASIRKLKANSPKENSTIGALKYELASTPNSSLLWEEFKEYLKDNHTNDIRNYSNDNIADMIRNYILKKELIKIAKDKKIDNTKEFSIDWTNEKNKLRNTLDTKLVKKVIANIVSKEIEYNPKQMKDFYEKYKYDFRLPDQFKLRKIIFRSKSVAEEFFAKKEMGVPLERLMIIFKKSIRFESLPYMEESDFGDEFEEINKLQPKEITSLQKEKNTYFAYQLINREPGAIPEYSLIKTQIKQKVFNQLLNNWLEDYIDDKNIVIRKKIEEL